MTAERLQKILAHAGIASRRKAEELILAGRVRVDGRTVTELGTSADPRRARIEVNGRRIVAEAPVYIVLNKPREVVSTLRDPEGRPTVAELVRAVGARVYPVGRLDYQTSGALLFSNDGEFASVLAHPRHEVPKTYLLKVRGEVNDSLLDKLRQSIPIAGKATAPAEVHRTRVEGGRTWLTVVLREGRNRQVRRLAEHAGLQVQRLHRLAQAGISVDGLRPGQWRGLTREELIDLKRAYGVPRRVRAAARAEAPQSRRTPKRRPTKKVGRRPPQK